jgi:drug/metabolite transporter (DMT)-like permease
VQDTLSRHLAENYNVLMVVMIRFWFFAAFVVALAARQAGGIRAAAATKRPVIQIVRGLLLPAEVCIMVLAFTLIGLVDTHAVFVTYPLLVAALSGPVLGEKVGWRRWTAIGIGFVGVIIILQPGSGVFTPAAAIPLLASFMFALYALLTRGVAKYDGPATSFFWSGTVGAAAMTVVGIWFWEPMTLPDWGFMAGLCVTGVLGHWFMIRSYDVAEASAVQPFAFLQLLWIALMGMFVFGEHIAPNVAIGAVVVVAASLFTLWRERVRSRG